MLPLCRDGFVALKPFQGVVAFALTRPRSPCFVAGDGGDLSMHAWLEVWRSCVAAAEMEHLDPSALVRSLRCEVVPSFDTWYPPLCMLECIDDVCRCGKEVCVRSVDAEADAARLDAPIVALSMDSRFGCVSNDLSGDMRAFLRGLFLLRDGRFALLWLDMATDVLGGTGKTERYFAAFIGRDLCAVLRLAGGVCGRPLWTETDLGFVAWADLRWDALPDSILVDVDQDSTVPSWCAHFEENWYSLTVFHLDRLKRVARMLEASHQAAA